MKIKCLIVVVVSAVLVLSSSGIIDRKERAITVSEHSKVEVDYNYNYELDSIMTNIQTSTINFTKSYTNVQNNKGYKKNLEERRDSLLYIIVENQKEKCQKLIQ